MNRPFDGTGPPCEPQTRYRWTCCRNCGQISWRIWAPSMAPSRGVASCRSLWRARLAPHDCPIARRSVEPPCRSPEWATCPPHTVRVCLVVAAMQVAMPAYCDVGFRGRVRICQCRCHVIGPATPVTRNSRPGLALTISDTSLAMSSRWRLPSPAMLSRGESWDGRVHMITSLERSRENAHAATAFKFERSGIDRGIVGDFGRNSPGSKCPAVDLAHISDRDCDRGSRGGGVPIGPAPAARPGGKRVVSCRPRLR